jgi:hypothetical protein
MGNSGGLGTPYRGTQALCIGGLVGRQRLAGSGLKLGDGVCAEGDADGGPVGVSVVVDLELEGGK